MNLEKFDIVIVGARCGGASLATFLAQKGYSICVIDKSKFPSDTLSTHIFGDWDLYKKLGIDQEIKAAGAPEISRFRMNIDGCILEAPMYVTSSVVGLRRIKLDQILINRMLAYPNIHFKENCRLVKLIYDDDCVCGIEVKDNNETKKLYSTILVGADGRHSRVAKLTGKSKYNVIDSPRCLFYGYFKNVLPNPIPTFEFFWHDDDILLLNPTDNGLHCLVVMPKQQKYKEWLKSPRNVLMNKISQIDTISSRFLDATLEGNIRGTDLLQSYLRPAFGNGWVLVGDAGASVHPCAGAGIDQAIYSAEILTDGIDLFLQNKSTWMDAMTNYQKKRDEYVLPNLNGAIHLANLPPLGIQSSQWLRFISTIPPFTHKFINCLPEFISGMMTDEEFNDLQNMIRG
ncbi:hypothetical protein CN636_17150 [Bacillus toyonensis]|nr:hypothetical protein CN636_17150 [Bacillus toyonensis]